ncbi:hypothetical protein BXY57_1063 [Thermoflavifilum aggregans]|uniref:Outer membrane protein with beta-barrel domain n=2 Tax=Thermoflavifilum aggregans TaxID=454188 RepID=A0A2M9CU85_9BACT|nr:hypothetical protein BXY57_1063 [Thermoflavifilum aggregans]
MKSFLILVLTFYVFIFKFAHAQQVSSSSSGLGLALSVGVEVAHFYVSPINAILQQHGLPEVPETVIYPAGTIADPVTSRFWGDAHVGVFAVQRSNNQYETHYSGHVFNANLFGLLLHKHHFRLCPGLGFGFLDAHLLLRSKTDNPVTIDDAVTNLSGSRELVVKYMDYLNPQIFTSLGLDRDEHYLLGLRAGYRIGLNRPHWQLENGNSLANAPTASAKGLYAELEFIIQ